MLVIFGGAAIKDFALALMIGIIVGTYSSILLAGPLWLAWVERKIGENKSWRWCMGMRPPAFFSRLCANRFRSIRVWGG